MEKHTTNRLEFPEVKEHGESFELSEALKEELKPFVQDETNLDDIRISFEKSAAEIQGPYELIRTVENVRGYMHSLLCSKWPELDNGNRKLMYWFDGGLKRKKTIEELSDLKERNKQEATRANLVLIPQWHPSSPENEGSEEINTAYGKQITASNRSIAHILQILNRFTPKIAVEGEAAGRKVCRMDEQEIAGVLKKVHTNDPETVQRINKYVTEHKNDRPWLYNKAYDVHGAESAFLRALLYQFNIACRQEVECDEELRRQIQIVFSVLMRQQFAIETSLERLNEDELGVIVIGATHIPTMRQYLAKQHPTTTVETIIPKCH